MTWKVEFTETSLKQLKAIDDVRVRTALLRRAERLGQEPENQGKGLTAELAGYRSLRAVGQRFRIIYQLLEQRVVVVVVALGLRKEKDKRDVYALARKLIRVGLLDKDER